MMPDSAPHAMPDANHDEEIVRSWNANAGAWTRAVRSALIPSRAAGTDQAILEAVRRHRPRTVLDAGCGEGWLARALAADGCTVAGIDGSEPLIAMARDLGGASYRVLPYDDLVADPDRAGGPYDAVVLNFALFSERVAPLLAALASRLERDGVVLIQTLHPWSSAGETGYVDGWRVATFAGFGGPFPATMPWFYRTLSRWTREIDEAGLSIERVDEPRHPATMEPLSLVMTLRRGPVRPEDPAND